MAASPLNPSQHASLPCFVRTGAGYTALAPPNMAELITQELDVSKLDDLVSRGLWLAGRVGNVRPLHRQHMLQRRIVVTERLDMHLIWHTDVIFLKPLPDWILEPDFMKQHINSNHTLAGSANGFLASYARLINHQSDFHIAKDKHLFPESLTWDDWRTLSPYLATLAADIATGAKPCSPRFHFGELRLSRVNMIYRYHPAYKFKHFLRGYYDRSQNYQSFLRRNFAWLLAVFIYVTVVLTAMQVGLGTTQLRDNGPFNNASYGFTVFAILLPLAALVLALLASSCLTIYNVRLTRRHLRQHFPNTAPDPSNNV